MSTITEPMPGPEQGQDPAQRKRLVMGLLVWAAGWGLALGLIPVVNGSNLSDGMKTTLDGILLLGCPKVFLIIAISIMGKPGFAYLKGLIGSHFKRLAPPATVSPMRYRIGMTMFIALVISGSIGPYIAADALPWMQENRRLIAIANDLLLLASLFVLGGDFWDKLRALFIRDAKVVFPHG